MCLCHRDCMHMCVCTRVMTWFSDVGEITLSCLQTRQLICVCQFLGRTCVRALSAEETSPDCLACSCCHLSNINRMDWPAAAHCRYSTFCNLSKQPTFPINFGGSVGVSGHDLRGVPAIQERGRGSRCLQSDIGNELSSHLQGLNNTVKSDVIVQIR